MINNILGNKKTFISRQLASTTLVAILATASDYAASILSTVILGSKIGEIGLIVVGLNAPILSLQLFVCDFLCGGAVYIRNVAISEGKIDKGDRIAGNVLLMSTGLGIFIFIALFFFPDVYLSFFELSEETYKLAVLYIKWSAVVPLLNIITYYAYEFVFRLNEKISSILMIITCTLGVLLFGVIYVDKYGMIGMAYANIAAGVITDVIGIITILLHKRDISFKFKYVKEEMHELYAYGFAYSQDTIYSPIYSAIITVFISHRFGESVLAVYAIIECVKELCSVFYGVSYAAENHLCIYMGEHNTDGLKKTIAASIKLQAVIAVLFEIIVLIFAEPIAEFMGMESIYRDETILALRLYASTFIILAFVCYLGDLYAAEEKTKACVSLYMGQILIGGVVLSVALGFLFGSIGLYIGKMLEAPIALLVSFIANKKIYNTRNLFLLDKDEGRIYSFDYDLTEDNVMDIQGKIMELLEKKNVDSKTNNMIILSFEELSMASIERNKKGKYAECTIFFNEKSIDMIVRNNGKVTSYEDLINHHNLISPIRWTIISNYIAEMKNARMINASNTNRISLSFPLNE